MEVHESPGRPTHEAGEDHGIRAPGPLPESPCRDSEYYSPRAPGPVPESPRRDSDYYSDYRGSIDDAVRSSYVRVERPLGVRVAYLLLTCSGSFGIYYGYNIVGATAPLLRSAPYRLTEEGIGGVMACYSCRQRPTPMGDDVVRESLATGGEQSSEHRAPGYRTS